MQHINKNQRIQLIQKIKILLVYLSYTIFLTNLLNTVRHYLLCKINGRDIFDV